MSAQRAELRRAARARPKIAVVAGVMRDRSDHSRRQAIELADRQLPPIANGQIRLALYTPDAGLKILAATVYQNDPAGLADVRSRLAALELSTTATEPTIVVARREPRSETKQETTT